MYEPQEQAPGGCRETLLLIRIAFQVLAPALFGLMAVIALIVLMFALLAQHPALALIPIGIVAAGLYALSRWDRRRERTLDDLDDEYRQGRG